jgi:hypothetical protein
VRFEFQEIELDDGTIDWAAILQVRVRHPSRPNLTTKRVELIVDSGSSDCILNADLLAPLGLELRQGKQFPLVGVSGKAESEAYYHEIVLVIDEHAVRVRAGFVAGLFIGGLLGRRGFFDEFNVAFYAPTVPRYFQIEKRGISHRPTIS